MIKLNNKNITYVALADSNNSFKAPKEIWYADSSNSVKLVYRRKDSLIEDEDYEKYHWLEGTTDAYISGVKYNVWQNKIQIKVGEVIPIPSATNYGYFVLKDGTDMPNLSIYKNVKNNQDSLQVIFRQSQGHIADIVPYQSFGESAMTFYVDNGVATVEQDGVVHSGESLTESTWNTDVKLTDANNKMAKVSYIRELLPNNTYRSNLIPCKLLKPVPKWLDANGIRRQVGECGMIDLVSGKFYGNVNSVGTFTVENYYERKEWLCGDGSAYIDTNIKNLTNVHYIDILISVDGVDYGNSHFFGRESVAPYYNSQVVLYYVSNRQNISVWANNVGHEINFADIVGNVTLNLDTNIASTPTDSVEFSIRNYNSAFSIFLFASNNNGNASSPFIGKIKKLEIDGIFHLVPCTLTMDLPASMDANNIARTKGTSGMWDLVSDKFYGNVANSGTFKAVNLAEGVDYEVHQWLIDNRIDGNYAYIQGIEYDLWNNHLQMIIGQSSRGSNRFFTYTDGNNCVFQMYRENPTDKLNVVFRESSGTQHIADVSPYSEMSDGVEFDFYIENALSYCKKNGVIYTNNGNPTCTQSNWTSIQPTIYSARMGYIRELLPNNTYRSNLIPVKLLRSIPSKYDANGIARNAGECGMYDTVNDVFYGNVASSGSFTVEDDN